MKQTTFLLALALPVLLSAQKRYFDPVFSQVKVTTDVSYGANYVLPFIVPPGIHTVRQILLMDVYEPEGDTASSRPLVILVHGGNFIPWPQNGSCNGTGQDGEIVEIATRLARRGYVVAAMDYRIGWNPLASTEIARRFSFVNAVHRGVQDSRTCIRFFRKDHAEQNRFRIDPEKITLWGTESGSYISLASATLDDMSDWDKEKFRISPTFPMVQDTFNGNLDGTTVGVVTPTYNAITGLPLGDTLCSPNHLGFSSEFALAVNMSNGLLDSDWLQSDDIPILSFASPSGIATGLEGDLCKLHCICNYLPPNFLSVLGDVAGSCTIQTMQTALGNNAVWLNAAFSDPLSLHSLSINNGQEGFYPFLGVTELTPWAFSTMPGPPNLACDTNSVEAGIYLDTVLAYFAPRACAALGLNAECTTVAVKTPSAWEPFLIISPNPSSAEISISAKEPILSFELYDQQGRMVQHRTGLNALEVFMLRENLPAGIYWLKVYFVQEISIGKILWE